jgi:dolichol-phosphate mannosyltransferase
MRTLSVIVPALNEEASIADAVEEIKRAVDGKFVYEVLLFDDGSTDRTGAIMDELALRDPTLRVTHNPRPRNLGGVYKQGLELARYEYVVMVPGDNENPAPALEAPLAAIGRADIVVPYVGRSKRSLRRVLISRAYVLVMNALFGLRLRYYNGTVVHRAANLREITIDTDSFGYQSEALIKLLRLGKSFVEVPVDVQPRPARASKAFRPKNVYGVIAGILRLAWQVHFAGAKRATRAAEG